MDIKLVYMYFEDTPVPFLEVDGLRYTTGSVLAVVLGIQPDSVTMTRQRHASKFKHSLRLEDSRAKGMTEFLRLNKDSFDIRRLRKDLILFELREAITLAFFARSEKASEFSTAVVDFYADHMRAEYVTKEAYTELLSKFMTLAARLERLEEKDAQLSPFLRSTASIAGKSLAAQRFTKPYRLN